jgi:uncharacterized protein YutE (UPF0331/DUF86 family)
VVEFKYAQGRIPESIQFISEEIREFEQDYLEKTWREYQEDRKLQKLVDRTVENILTALIEVCGTFLTERGKASDNYADVLRASAGLLGLPTEEQNSLAALAVQRNRLAHRYLDLRWQAVRDFGTKRELVKKLLKLILDRQARDLQIDLDL